MPVSIKGVNYFKALWHSDQHNLHPRTSTKHICGSVDHIRNKVGYDTDLDMWGGDLCHKGTSTSDPDYVYLQSWVKDYLYERHKNKRYTIIIEGTDSHDRGQPKMFELLKPKGSKYVIYVDKLDIVYLDELGINILCVPDNFGKKPKSEIYEEAIKLLAKHNLSQVDFIMLHGGWEFNNPDPHHIGNVYNSELWSPLAKHAIFSGHIHKPAKKGNIYSSGSLDRIAHGEMHAKGAYEFYFNKNDFKAKFIENDRAMIYDTITLTEKSTSKDIINKLDRYLDKNPMKGAYIRLAGGDGNIVSPIIKEYSETYPWYNFEALNADIKGVEIDSLVRRPEDYERVVITEDNFKDNFFSFLESRRTQIKHHVDDEFTNLLLDELMNEK